MKKSILTSLVAASALFTGVAFAGSYSADAGYTAADTSAMAGNDSIGQGWYVGVGANRTAQNSYDLNVTTANEDLSADSQKVGVGVLVGKHINEMFAVELGYNSYGTNTFTDNAGDEVDYYGMYSVTAMGVVNTPAWNGLSAHAKAGAAYFSENFKDSEENDVAAVSGSYSGTNFAYGFGAQYDFKQFGVSLDWTRIAVSDSNTSIDNSSIYAPDQYSVNFLYNFG